MVVRAVSEESMVLNDADTMPMMNSSWAVLPNQPEAANMGSSSSGDWGRAMSCWVANCMSRMPRHRKSRLTGTKANPYVQTSFWASRRVLQVRFFCIMFWLRPVITITINAPLTNCFQKFCFDIQSSKTNMRLWLSLAMACTASPKSISSLPVT